MTEPRGLQISARMRAFMDYPRFSGPVPRMLVLESNYWLDVACLNAAQDLGWVCERVPVLQEGHMPRDMVARFIERLVAFKPDFVLSVNLSGMDAAGIFAGLFAQFRMPYVTWFVDDPRTIIMGRTVYGSDYALALTWERAYAGYLEAAGFAAVHPLPLAADVTLFNAEPVDETGLPPAFVGNSMADFAAREWAWVREHPILAEAIDAAFAAGRVTRENFATGMDAILPGTDASLDTEERRHAEMLCFIEGTRRLRFGLLETLAPEGLHVRGDEAWKQHFDNWGPYINYTADLPAYYRACPINLNSTSIQMASAVNQRVFDCPAAGGFLLSDAQRDLETLFEPETEIVRYASPEECLDLYRFHRERPQARKAVIEKARRRVLAEHTYHHRIEKIAALVREHFDY